MFRDFSISWINLAASPSLLTSHDFENPHFLIDFYLFILSLKNSEHFFTAYVSPALLNFLFPMEEAKTAATAAE